MSAPRSRRELVADVLSAMLPASDLKLLTTLLDAERLAVAVYGQAAASSAVSPAARRLLVQINRQEQSHASVLARATGNPEPYSQPALAQIETALAGHGIKVTLSTLASERAWFTLLERLEAALEGAYYKAIARLSQPAGASLAARIMANEAQHSTVLFSFRNPTDINLDVAVGLVKGSAGGQ